MGVAKCTRARALLACVCAATLHATRMDHGAAVVSARYARTSIRHNRAATERPKAERGIWHILSMHVHKGNGIFTTIFVIFTTF